MILEGITVLIEAPHDLRFNKFEIDTNVDSGSSRPHIPAFYQVYVPLDFESRYVVRPTQIRFHSIQCIF